MSDPAPIASGLSRETLERIACVALETVAAVGEWRGHASTAQAAFDSLDRLAHTLARAGFTTGYRRGDDWSPLYWRGCILRALDAAGCGATETNEIRVRLPTDPNWREPSGPLLSEVLADLAHKSAEIAAEMERLKADRVWELELLRTLYRVASNLLTEDDRRPTWKALAALQRWYANRPEYDPLR